MAPIPPKKTAAPTPEQPRKPQLDKLAELSSLEKQFSEAPATEFGTKLPDGIYQARCLKTVFARSNSADEAVRGQPQIRIVYQVVIGALKGREFAEFYTLKDDDAIGRFKGRIKALGYPYATLADCSAALSAMESDGRIWEFELVMRKVTTGKNAGSDFQNINFRRIVDSAADAADVAELAAEGVDEEAAEEAEEAPKVQHNARNAPPPRQGKRKVAEDVDDMIEELP